jgi:hypothetical protein
MARYKQGKFKPKNPNKYKGDITDIVYRSGWELKLMLRLDEHPNVVWWGSETTVIPYRSPIDGKVHRYFVDMIAQIRQPDGKTKTLLIEIKPKAQTIPPVLSESKTKTKRYLREVMTWGVNEAKWKAAEEFAKDRGFVFQIFTEKELGIK